MCLSREFSESEFKAVLPKRKFKAFKFVTESNGKLVSPVYHYEWKVGEHKTDGEGFYVTSFEPGKVSSGGGSRIEVTVDPKDVKKAGPDQHGGYKGTCFVCKKVAVSQKQYDEAMGIKKEAIASGMKKIRAIKKTQKKTVKKKTQKLVNKLVKKVKTAVKKATKKATKKVPKKRK